MKIMEEQKHFLGLMARVGDYIFIDISKLDIARDYHPTDLADIDSFTLHFTKDEILSSIIRGNLVSGKYLNGKLVICDNQKHKPKKVIDKTFYNNFQIDKYLLSIINDKNMVNTLLNKFKALNEIEEINNSFAYALNTKNIDLIVDILFNLPYLTQRKYIIYLIELRNKSLVIFKNNELIRDKAA